MNASSASAQSRWSGAWIDLLAFAGGLALAWFGRWQTADLVWSLWLSSLLVGYALIVWTLSTTVREFAVNAMRDRTPNLAAGKGAAGGVLVLGFLFGLAFFTVHFGGFHFVHSAFLQAFFPLEVEGRVARNFPDLQLYAEVFRQYWVFVPLAFMAEREAFRRQPGVASDTTVTPAAIKRRKEQAVGSSLMAPYKNVVRMHLLIFFFAGAHVLRLESFAIYAVVYAVYFFPWRMLRREKRKAES